MKTIHVLTFQDKLAGLFETKSEAIKKGRKILAPHVSGSFDVERWELGGKKIVDEGRYSKYTKRGRLFQTGGFEE